jgi:hypothetical protein
MPSRTPRRSPGAASFDQTSSSKARKTIGQAVAAGAETYRRDRDLPKLIGVFAGTPEADFQAIVGKLRKALRAERIKARSGHWTYDLNRHIALRQAYLAEVEALQERGNPVRLTGAQARERF